MPSIEKRIKEAQQALKDLGLPPSQQNELSGLTLLSLAGLRARDQWSRASCVFTRPHDILSFINDHYSNTYAENTRETVRRQVLHQFEQAALIVRNADDPARATNSPKTNYSLSPRAFAALQSFGSEKWDRLAAAFQADAGSLADIYRKPRSLAEIPVTLPNGQEFRLSPGKHNEIQVAVVEAFAPRFAPGARVLYFGDTAEKALFVATPQLSELGIPVTEHDKLPDVVLLLHERSALVLVEVVTSHGPVSPKRWHELEDMFAPCGLRRVYVSAFPSFQEFKRHLDKIAWETEVWLADMPDHMIHYNGEKFLGIL